MIEIYEVYVCMCVGSAAAVQPTHIQDGAVTVRNGAGQATLTIHSYVDTV